ncbi:MULTISPECIES: hypothetical protein [Laspinema]|jgi:hypothetical protein|uniref:Uncharacterized protein n=1 Tax=Laspinema olomoucense D3b TaxID=2953688 RepID=A0ABT2NBL7_9CYAN|nr:MULTISPECIES: hypothetical protein [unclassified Laspinema]MCT7957797.1 hypothetical protein [Laspinema sp. D2c]MCT7975613.1 hypothetical protein [Laspinema sp. D3d]MCT7980089.1 hypothetical protein [Laspinema sp. D3b]MCT7991263.1 hypothetical protein [Laspinema sp. D3a]MCT7996392.1 hypothetical protein [Laspinema sp. D3c]
MMIIDAIYQFPNLTVTDVFSHIYSVGRITQRDRQFIKVALLEQDLSDEEITLIDRLVYAVRRGWLQMID